MIDQIQTAQHNPNDYEGVVRDILGDFGPSIVINPESNILANGERYSSQVQLVLEKLQTILESPINRFRRLETNRFEFLPKKNMVSLATIDPNAFDYHNNSETFSGMYLLQAIKLVAEESKLDYIELFNAIAPLFYIELNSVNYHFIDVTSQAA